MLCDVHVLVHSQWTYTVHLENTTHEYVSGNSNDE